ncbi:MAG: acetate--CoA ligase family protein [Candidatus Micrarchaeota archaeon]|nr:acetate--CoA ligase family protein [Candidatus Micrarchaeota archaeon]
MELMDYEKARALLSRYGIKSAQAKYVNSAEDAIAFSGGEPIVLKAISQKALHKTKNKLVALDLCSKAEITNGYNVLVGRASGFKPYRILAQKMVGNGIEMIIGGKMDEQFGKMLLVGLGGIYVEVFKDFSLRLCPITKRDAQSMLEQLKSMPVLAPNPQKAGMLVELLMKVSRMFESSEIKELDLNPIILHDDTYDVVDIRIIR